MRGLPIVMVLALGLAVSAARATEQTVTPIVPQVEQHVEGLDAGQTQRVEMVDTGATQDVGTVTPPTPSGKAASTAGKVAVGFMAVILSLAAMAAQIIFI